MADRDRPDRPLPLMQWLEQQRETRKRTVLLRRRAFTVGVLGTAFALTVLLPPRPLLVWNASASAPIGLYAVSPASRLQLGDMVIASPPPAMRELAARRGYIPLHVPLVKRVAALAGQEVCGAGAIIRIDGRNVARRRERDARRRPLPAWQGCYRLAQGDVFLLMRETPASFDGRYFGVTNRTAILGKARLLWAR